MSDEVTLSGAPPVSPEPQAAPELEKIPVPMLCFAHGGSPAAAEHNAKYGFACPKCAEERSPGVVADPVPGTGLERPAAQEEADAYDRVRLFKMIREELTEFATVVRVLDGLSNDATILPHQHSSRRPILRACNIAAVDHVAKTLLMTFETYTQKPLAKKENR